MLGLVASASFQCTRGNVCVGRTGLATQVFGELQAAINRYLEALGVATIHVTGVIDPATANAITIVSKSYPDVFARMPPSISQHATATFTPQYVAEHADELFHALGMFAPRSTPKAAPANPVNQPRGGVAPSTSSTSPAVSKPKGGGFKPPGGTLKPPGGTLKPPPGTTPRPSTSPSASRNPATAPAPGPSSTDPTLDPTPDQAPMIPGPSVVAQDSGGGSSILPTPPPLPTINVGPSATTSSYDDAAATRKLTIGLIVVAAVGAVASATGYLFVRRRRKQLLPVAP